MEMFEILTARYSKEAKKLENGWTYSANFNHYQKVKNQVYVYVTPQLFGRWVTQMYPRGEAGICSLEARINDGKNIEKLFELAEKWLEKYGDGLEGLENDPYYPFGNWQGEDITDEELLY